MVAVVGLDTSKILRITCRCCAAILEYLPIEKYKRTYKDYGGGSNVVEYIMCPKCTKNNNKRMVTYELDKSIRCITR